MLSGAAGGSVRRQALLVTAASVVLAACVRTVDLGTVEVAQDIRDQAIVRTAHNLPPRFDVVVAPSVAGDCPPRLGDGALGTVLSLNRSMMLSAQDTAGRRELRSFGDYVAAPRGQYGDVQPNDALRVDCARLRAVGIVSLPLGG